MLSWVHDSAQAFSPLRRARYALIGILAAVLVTGGCSIRRYAVNTIGDVLASGGSLYESDDDIVLIGDALPFRSETASPQNWNSASPTSTSSC